MRSGILFGRFVSWTGSSGGYLVLNGRAEDLPMYAIQIVDKDLNVQTRYEKQGFYLGSVEVEDSRIHIQRLDEKWGSPVCIRRSGYHRLQ